MNISVEKKLNWISSILPEPFKSEFFEDVLIDIDDYDLRTLNKVFTYYIDDCQNELPKDCLDKIREKYVFIRIC